MIDGLVILWLGQSYCNIGVDMMEQWHPEATHVRGCCGRAHVRASEWAYGSALDDAIAQLDGRTPDLVVVDFGEIEIRRTKTKKHRARLERHVEALLDRIATTIAPTQGIVGMVPGRWIESRKSKHWPWQRWMRQALARAYYNHPGVCAVGDRWDSGPRHRRWYPNPAGTAGHHEPARAIAHTEAAIGECAQ